MVFSLVCTQSFIHSLFIHSCILSSFNNSFTRHSGIHPFVMQSFIQSAFDLYPVVIQSSIYSSFNHSFTQSSCIILSLMQLFMRSSFNHAFTHHATIHSLGIHSFIHSFIMHHSMMQSNHFQHSIERCDSIIHSVVIKSFVQSTYNN